MPEYPSPEHLEALIDHQGTPKVSLYLPTHRYGAETQQGPIRLKNLLGAATEELIAGGLRRPEVDELLGPARRLLTDGEFWQYQADGLAVLLSPGDTRLYSLEQPPEELVLVGDRFHFKPLVETMLGEHRFWLLALSRRSVRFFRGGRRGLSEERVDVPSSIDDANWFQEREPQLQFHSSLRGGGGIFHGHEGGRDSEDLARFLRAVAHGVGEATREEPAPLVVAAVDELRAAYREVAESDLVLEDGPGGSPDDLAPHQLHERAWPLVERHFEQRRQAAVAELAAAVGAERAAAGVEEVLQAAQAGRVARLYLRRGEEVWGRWDGSSCEVHAQRQSGDEDLTDRALALTVQLGGEALLVPDDAELPMQSPAAVLRF
jgi:hypothetical protein